MAATPTLDDLGNPVIQPDLAPDPNAAPPADPDYVFGSPEPAPPAGLTAADLDAAVQRALQGSQRIYDDPEDNELAQIAAIQFSDPAAAERRRREIYARDNKAQISGFQNQMAEMIAPMVRTQITDNLTRGLCEASKQHVAGYLTRYNAAGLASINGDKETLDMLRYAAMAIHSQKSGAAVNAPTSEAAASSAQNTDPDVEAAVDRMWEQWKTVPGMTRDKIRATAIGAMNNGK